VKKILDYYKYQLSELLLNTLSPHDAISKITEDVIIINKFEYDNDIFNFDVKGNNLILLFKNVDYNKKEIMAILSSIYSTGYFISQYYLSKKEIKNKLIKSEDEFIENINNEIIDFKMICEPKHNKVFSNIPKHIYHITDSKNSKTILKNGLLPSSKKKKSDFPHRNHFLLNINYRDIVNNFKFLDKINNKKKNYDLLEINVSNLKSKNFKGEIYDIVFYEDPNSKGIYSYDLIRPNNIKLYKKNI
jgi:hypothetical protein